MLKNAILKCICRQIWVIFFVNPDPEADRNTFVERMRRGKKCMKPPCKDVPCISLPLSPSYAIQNIKAIF